MKVLILSSSPNKVGLTMSCVEECKKDIEEKKYEVDHLCLNDYKIERCVACGERGWGICFKSHICKIKDDFNDLYKKMDKYDAYIFITPVYFWEMSESAKTFFDRLRRCDSFKEESMIKGKNVIFIAAAGGSGRGTEECLKSMDILAHFLKLNVISRIGITKNNFEEEKTTIKNAVNNI